jgi:hypothetical protein
MRIIKKGKENYVPKSPIPKPKVKPYVEDPLIVKQKSSEKLKSKEKLKSSEKVI